MSDIFTLTPDEGDGGEPTPQKKRGRRRSKPVIALITLASVLVVHWRWWMTARGKSRCSY